MKVPKKILKIWKSCLAEASQKEVAKEYKLNALTIRRVLKKGTCEVSTFDTLNAFCIKHKADKRKLVEQLDAE